MATLINLPAYVDYLVRRRFPTIGRLAIMPSLSNPQPMPDTRQLKADVEAYKAELFSLSFEDLSALVEVEKQKEGGEIRARLEREERERFFNQRHAQADYDHWSKAAYWSLDEAIALSFGRAPEYVRWEKLQGLTMLGSPFVNDYGRRRDLAQRAVTAGQLHESVLPGVFLAWARRLEFDVPQELIAAVEKRGVQIADWKTRYDEVIALLKEETELRETQVGDWKRLFDQATAQTKSQHAEWTALLDQRNEQVVRLESKIVDLEQSQQDTSAKSEEKPLGLRERESLLKLAIGMAIIGYGHDPAARRSEQIGEIAKDLALAGVALDADTVRKWLKEAAELLPPKVSDRG